MNKISKQIRLLTILQSGRHYTIDDLTKMLGAARRTVFRYLRELKEAEIPCYYDREKHYYTMAPGFFQTPTNLSDKEALGFLLLVKARNQVHLPLEDLALRAALKIESNLATETKWYCASALRIISVIADPRVKMRLSDTIFLQLLEAALERQQVKIRYYLPYAGQKNITTDLSPCHFVFSGHMWYVIGKSSFHKRICTFKVSRIMELVALAEYFTEDKEFDVREYLGKAWKVAPEPA